LQVFSAKCYHHICVELWEYLNDFNGCSLLNWARYHSQCSNWLQGGLSGNRILVGTRFSAAVQTGPGAHPASWTMGTWSFPGVKSGWGVTLTPHPLLVPWSRKSRPVPLLPLWAIRPVQSLSACTRVHFTFFTLEFYICHEGVCQCGHLSGHILKLCTWWGPAVCFKLQPVYIQCKSALLSIEQEAGWAAEPVQLLWRKEKKRKVCPPPQKWNDSFVVWPVDWMLYWLQGHSCPQSVHVPAIIH